MKCEEVRSILEEVVEEDSLIPEGISAHLLSCAACAAYRKEQERLWATLDLLPPIEPTPGFAARFWDRAREVESRAGWKNYWAIWLPAFLWRRTAAVAALTSLLLVCFFLILYNQPTLPRVFDATEGNALEDEQLLESLGMISRADVIPALGVYDLWPADTDEPQVFPTPLLVPLENDDPDSAIRGASHEKTG